MGIYEENLRVLKSKFPEVYDWIVKEGEDKRIEIIRTKSGLSNLRFKGLPGEQVCLYGMVNPLEEEIERCKDLDLSANKITFLVGIGLGYILHLMKKRMQKGHKVIVFENHAAILKKALSQIDVTELLREDSLAFSLADDESVKKIVIKNTATHVSQVEILWGSSRGLEDKKEYLELKERVYKISSQAMSAMLTTVSGGRVLAHNEIENIPKFLFSPGIENLFNRFEKIPGIVISAGPSLERNVHLLKQAEGKALLVATLPVVRVLLAYDIKPDLMISIDFNEGNRLHFEGLWDVKEIPLLYPLFLASSIVNDFQGDLFAIQPDEVWLSEHWENKGTLSPSGSVAGFALKAAIALGCDPVVFVGQDLSYSEKTHIEGSARSRKFDRAQQGEEVFWGQGLNGQPVLTSERFIAFLRDIEETIASHDRKFINSTAIGLRIRGTEEISLKECIDQYCRRRVSAGSIIQEAKTLGKVDFPGLLKALEAQMDGIKDALSLCLKALKVNQNIKKNLRKGFMNNPSMTALVKESQKIGIRLQDLHDSFKPFQFFLSKDFSLANRHEHMNRNDYSQEKNLTLYVERNQLIFSAAHQALKKLLGIIIKLFALMKRIKSCRDGLENRSEDVLAHYQYGKALAEIGLHRLAIEEYAKAFKLGQDSFPIYYELGRSSLKLGEMKRAREYFQEAQARAKTPASVQKEFQEMEEVILQHLEKAQSCLQGGNWVNALLYARKVIREDPGSELAQRIEREARILRDEKVAQMELANEKEREQQERGEEYRGWMEKGKEFLDKREFMEAIAAFTTARQLDPGQNEAHLFLACCYSEIGDMGEAEQILGGLIGKFPESGVYHFTLGRAFIRNGNLLKGAEQLKMAAIKEKQYSLGFFEAGSIYMKAQNYHKAIESFEKYLEVSPESYELLGKIGTCFLALGMLEEAKVKYGAALRIQPAYVPAQIGLQKIEQLQGRRANGIQEH